MGFWIFTLCFNFMTPLIMFVFGRSFINNPPREINKLFGYRTSMSMKNKETWDFAHHYIGRLWYACSPVMLTLTFLAMLVVFGEPKDTIGTVGGAVSVLQLIVLVGSIVPTELALRRSFHKDGSRR